MNTKYQFGEKIRRVRERKGLTLKEIAGKAGVSESLISQIERNKISPSLDTLLTIVTVLNINIDYLFEDYKMTSRVSIVRASERNRAVQNGVVYNQLNVLADPRDDYEIEALLLEIEPGSEKGSREYGHNGKEMGFILEGTAELLYGKHSYELYSGDSITFSSEIPHTLRNTGDGVLKALWIITPPRRLFSMD